VLRALAAHLCSRRGLVDPLLRCVAVFCAALFASNALPATGDSFAEYELKAGYIYNFITFTEWPEAVPSVITLCVYGQDPFGASLDNLQGKKVGQRSLAVSRINSVDQVSVCQAVFVSMEAISNLARLEQVIAETPVLLIADSPGAALAGVAINLVNEGDKVSFEINLKSAQKHGLNLSYRLLQLAREVFS
jgi:hypothetical protein